MADQSEDSSYGLTKEEELKCWEAFSAFDKDSSGYIDSHELRIVLEMMGQRPTQEEIFKMISEVDQDHTGHIAFQQFKRVISEQKKHQSQTNEEDTLDAFIAMGGGPGKEGYIDAQKLIKVIKQDFEMTIDIVKLIKDIDTDNSGKIEYAEFKNLLSSN